MDACLLPADTGPWRDVASPVGDPDGQLVEAARRGDREAFGALVERHQRRVFNLARALTNGCDDEAEDLAQEVFIRAFRGIRRFRGESAFTTWLHRIVVNTFRSRQSRRSLWARRLRLDGDVVDTLDLEDARSAGTVDVEDQFARRDAIDRALAGLPPDLRMAVTLRDIEGLEYREIAEVTGVPIGTVESRIFRGRQRLRVALAPLMGPKS